MAPELPAPALWPQMVTWFGSPPNAAMLSRTNCNARCWSHRPWFPGVTSSLVVTKPEGLSDYRLLSEIWWLRVGNTRKKERKQAQINDKFKCVQMKNQPNMPSRQFGTTETTPRDARKYPGYWKFADVWYAPPWINTITGQGPPDESACCVQ